MASSQAPGSAGPGPELGAVVGRNIRALMEARRRSEKQRTLAHRLADRITAFTGSMKSMVLHVLLFGGWIVLNAGIVPGIPAVDPFPFVGLAMAASVEAIFLTTFVLISQNRMMELQDRRAELDLQIDLLAEHEITRLVQMVDGIAERLGVTGGRDANLDELKRDVRPEEILGVIDRTRGGGEPGG
jgi:uncharacterized membrane protein